ncbi:MAG: glycosyl transferase family 2 [Deltaproteobacteria bacterium RBG_13_52_11b]|nr:MAG: glycosyl transferase family 2 [Deltaproteobacteria bacterium RBG_13_52_11b]
MERAFQEQIDGIKGADIVVGFPSFNSVRTIGQVIRTVVAGLPKAFPAVKAVLIHSDSGSTDGTQEEAKRAIAEGPPLLFTSQSILPIHQLNPPHHGIPGIESALRTFFEAARSLNAKACAVVDPDLTSITPERIERLIGPVWKDAFDFVAPLYARHKFDGTLTSGIVYPLTRALYGKRVRQPIGRDFAFSGALAEFYLGSNAWESDVVRFGIDIWMTTVAVAEGFKVCQTYLGPRLHAAKGAESNLGSMFTQVVSSVYGVMEQYQDVWKKGNETQPVPTFGVPPEGEVEPVSVNVERMTGIFRSGIRNLAEIWGTVFPRETLLALKSMAGLSDRSFLFPPDVWVRIVYDGAVAYHKGRIHRDHLLKSMIPLYLGLVASLVREHQQSSPGDVEEEIETLCRVYEQLKPYLIGRWG